MYIGVSYDYLLDYKLCYVQYWMFINQNDRNKIVTTNLFFFC